MHLLTEMFLLTVHLSQQELLANRPYNPSKPFTQIGPLDSHQTPRLTNQPYGLDCSIEGQFFSLNLQDMDQVVRGKRLTPFFIFGSIMSGSFHPPMTHDLHHVHSKTMHTGCIGILLQLGMDMFLHVNLTTNPSRPTFVQSLTFIQC